MHAYLALLVSFVGGVLVLRKRFLDPYLGDPLVKPTEYDIDVRAFCVLSYAALEYYIESVALQYADDCIAAWKSRKEYEGVVQALCLYHGSHPDSIYKTSAKLPTYRAVVGASVDAAHQTWSKFVREKNHGAGSFNLKKVFWPLGVDIVSNVRFASSFDSLSRQRGAYAHKSDGRPPIAPETALGLVSDCMELAAELCDEITFLAGGGIDDTVKRYYLRILLSQFSHLSASGYGS